MFPFHTIFFFNLKIRKKKKEKQHETCNFIKPEIFALNEKKKKLKYE